MPRGVKKQHLPQKICVTCQRPFNWRKKWEKCWDDVTTCSKACNAARRARKSTAAFAFPLLALSGSESSESECGSHREDPAPNVEEKAELDRQEGEDQGIASAEIAAACLAREVPLNTAEAPLNCLAEEAGSEATDEAPEHESVLSAAPAAPWTARRALAAADAKSTEARAKRKADRKAAKLVQRQKREGTDASVGQKPCDLCRRPVDLLVRCMVDGTSGWRFVCGRCWKGVSGGVVDGDEDHPDYRYGGLWKNLHVRTLASAQTSAAA